MQIMIKKNNNNNKKNNAPQLLFRYPFYHTSWSLFVERLSYF